MAAEPGRWPGRLAGLAAWSYLVGSLSAWALVGLVGERHWLGTLFLFGPRYTLLLPVPWLVGVVSTLGRRRGLRLAAVLAGAAVVAGPVAGLNLGTSRAGGPGVRVRVMTLNRWVAPLDVPRLAAYIERAGVDVLCTQEGTRDPAFDAYLAGRGWHRDRQGRLATRYPILGELPTLDSRFRRTGAARCRLLIAPGVEALFVSAHLPTMHHGLDALKRGDAGAFRAAIAVRREEMALFAELLAGARGIPTIVAADLNTPGQSDLLAGLLRVSGLHSAFDDVGLGLGATFPAHRPWARLDHILASPEWTFTSCRVGPRVGSDHLPVLAEAVLGPRP